MPDSSVVQVLCQIVKPNLGVVLGTGVYIAIVFCLSPHMLSYSSVCIFLCGELLFQLSQVLLKNMQARHSDCFYCGSDAPCAEQSFGAS